MVFYALVFVADFGNTFVEVQATAVVGTEVVEEVQIQITE